MGKTTIRVVLFRADVAEPETMSVPHSLEDLQLLVGGYLEQIPMAGGQVMLADEEGLLKQLRPNHRASVVARRAIVGNAVLVRRRGADFVSVTDADLKRLR
jgi:hypothetical protein